MSSGVTLLLAFCIGIIAGLRSLTAPAVVAWAARLGWINLSCSPLAFMGSAWTVGIFTLLALGINPFAVVRGVVSVEGLSLSIVRISVPLQRSTYEHTFRLSSHRKLRVPVDALCIPGGRPDC